MWKPSYGGLFGKSSIFVNVMDRRDFIKTSAAVAAAAAVSSCGLTKVGAAAIPQNEGDPNKGIGKGKREEGLITSPPMLQNFAERSMGIAFTVSDMANGFVRYGTAPDLSNAVTVKCGGFRVTDMNPDVMLIRLTGLEPSTRYYYTIGADRIHYGGGYDMKVLSTEEDPTVYSFVTAGKETSPHFCVINDTHAAYPAMAAVTDKIAELDPSCVIWNGDLLNCEETMDSVKKIIIAPEITRRDFASRIPYLLCPGNHDNRGLAARHLERAWMFRDNAERDSADWDLGRNFAIRLGDIAMVGLDTAEDKVDDNPIFAGLFNSEQYRVAQTEWLRKTLKRKDIASAPYLVAFCHIPISDPIRKDNPGGLHPHDTGPGYEFPWAAWLKPCQDMWGPLLDEARCCCVISAHQHHYRFEERGGDGKYKWAQLVGGGYDIESEKDFPTVIEGSVEGDHLVLRVHNMHTGLVEDTYRFRRRGKGLEK